MDTKKIRWFTVAFIAFNMVWGMGNVVNNFAQQGITVVTSWLLILALYFIPYALIVGQLGSTFKDSKGGVSSWVENTSTKRLAYYAAWTYWVVHIPYLAQKPQAILIAFGWVGQGNGNLVNQMSMTAVALAYLAIFLAFLWLSTKGLNTLKVIGGLAGTAMFVMSLLFIVMRLEHLLSQKISTLQRLTREILKLISLNLTSVISQLSQCWFLLSVVLKKFLLMLIKRKTQQKNFQEGCFYLLEWLVSVPS